MLAGLAVVVYPPEVGEVVGDDGGARHRTGRVR
eukprot:CAMPEP_0117678084 /NCGR_PEP_ID=MMETSP0804-20121206/17089_1 /TAXON_ID=1074897 /ORGANISM="Tetraselmis astigmatica, Strain CCMP880" /LENGTH=32 /DNA_ID= /DNA_START= /DNA_END= /DNA_ORIENTATION=